MKWVVCRNRVTSDVTLNSAPGRRIRAKGGTGQSATDDAKVAATYKQVAKKSSTDALNNKQLQDLVTRMNLEQQYSRLSQEKKQQSAGKQLLDKFFKSPDAQKAAVEFAFRNTGRPTPGYEQTFHTASQVGKILELESHKHLS